MRRGRFFQFSKICLHFSNLGKSTEKYTTKLNKMDGDKYAAVLIIKNFAEEDLNNDYFLELKPGTPDALE